MDELKAPRPLAVVTGASTGIGVRAGMENTKVANDPRMMMEPDQVAKIGFQAMLKGEADVVAGVKNRMQVAISKVMPSQATAQMHRKLAEPGTTEPTLQIEHMDKE